MAVVTINGLKVVYSNSTAAANGSASGDEDGSQSLAFDVLTASGAGTGTTIYSVDNGTAGDDNAAVTVNSAFTGYDTDLLYSDAHVGSWTGDTSAAGAHVWIGTDNLVHYDASNLNATIQALGAGETFADTFLYTLRMSNGTLSVGHLSVTLTGENDAAAFGAYSGPSGVTEDASAAPAEGITEAASGTLAFTDVDWHDTHTASVESNNSNLGTLTASVTTDTYTVDGITYGVGDAATGAISLSYSVLDSAIDHLGQGDQITETFTVDLVETHPDASTSTDTHTVSYTIAGTNDAAVFAAGGDSASVVDDAGGEVATETAGGTLGFTDADYSDTHTVSVTGGSLGTLTIDPSDVTDTTLGVGGAINWHYSIADSALDALTAPTDDVFTVHLVEHHADATTSEVTENVTVHLTGGPDAPTDHAPVANDDTWEISNAAKLTITPDWMTWNDTDSDHDTLFITDVSGLPATGYQANYDGSHHLIDIDVTSSGGDDLALTYTLSDGTLTSTGHVALHIWPTSDASGTMNFDFVDLTKTAYDHSYIELKFGNDTENMGSAQINEVYGGFGKDTLVGHDGSADTFIYKDASDSRFGRADNRDTIQNFVHGEDKIDVSAIDANTAVDGDQAFTFNGTAATANGIWYTEALGTTTLHFDTDGSTGSDEMTIFLTGTSLGLTAGDFVL